MTSRAAAHRHRPAWLRTAVGAVTALGTAAVVLTGVTSTGHAQPSSGTARPAAVSPHKAAHTDAALADAAGTDAARTGAVRAGGVHLKCSARTVPGRPLTFRPRLTSTPRTVHAAGTVLLTKCTSPDGSQRHIKSGRLTFRGSAKASCTRASHVRGKGTITWYASPGARGKRLGTSTLTPRSRATTYTPGSTLLNGTVSSGRLAHQRATGAVHPTSNVRQCGTRGLRTLEGRGYVTFS
ncbi:hypothetical protein [Streptomyces iconiensis]|uniref:Ig-like domain-containing protein n=1 Tax=Streptomyces iconiensis TaxID=1384038 RepID=A0ABT7A874_9ACTN|nr:hypothetical protein [Streptomyces iconiensis]MDJ1137036.1 hypothetical protein [Streptomyces iconiensis]